MTMNEPMHTEPEATRRKLAESYRKRARGKRFTDAERDEFARLADMWEKTLPKNNKLSIGGQR